MPLVSLPSVAALTMPSLRPQISVLPSRVRDKSLSSPSYCVGTLPLLLPPPPLPLLLPLVLLVVVGLIVDAPISTSPSSSPAWASRLYPMTRSRMESGKTALGGEDGGRGNVRDVRRVKEGGAHDGMRDSHLRGTSQSRRKATSLLQPNTSLNASTPSERTPLSTSILVWLVVSTLRAAREEGGRGVECE